MLIVPSTVYGVPVPVHTCAVVIVQSPVMTPPTWSQVPARAAGLTATKAAKRPTRATDQMNKHVRAFPFRADRLKNPRPPELESAERIQTTTTGGHVAQAIRGLPITGACRE